MDDPDYSTKDFNFGWILEWIPRFGPPFTEEKFTFTSQISENSGLQLAKLICKNGKAHIFLWFL